jgi:hypothetical protein
MRNVENVKYLFLIKENNPQLSIAQSSRVFPQFLRDFVNFIASYELGACQLMHGACVSWGSDADAGLHCCM